MSCGCGSNELYRVPCDETVSDIGCVSIVDAQCVEYNGDTLECSNIEPGTRLESIIQIFDQKLCGITVDSDYSTFNTFCLDDEDTIGTEKEFVETISSFVCTLRTDVDTFIDVTFENYKTSVDVRFDTLEVPLVPSCLITRYGAATLPVQTLYNKFGADICTLITHTDITSVGWNDCYTVSSTPSTIAQGFDALIDMICQIKVIATSAGVDTYKVKSSSSDGNPNYLIDKLLSTSCVTWNTAVIAGVEKVYATIPTIYKYTFDATQFTSTVISTGPCVTEYLISINPSILSEPGGSAEVTCEDLAALFTTQTSPASTVMLYGTDTATGSCEKYDECAVRSWLFNSYSTGTYMININTAETGCSKLTLVPYGDLFMTRSTSTARNTSWETFHTTMTVSGTHSNGTWDISDFGNHVDGNIGANPSWKINNDGDLRLKGVFTLEAEDTTGGDPAIKRNEFEVTILTFATGDHEFTENQVVHVNTENIFSSDEAVGTISTYLILSVTDNTLKLRIHYAINDATIDTFNTYVLLDGITFNL